MSDLIYRLHNWCNTDHPSDLVEDAQALMSEAAEALAARPEGGMTEERAREILKGEIKPDGGLYNGGHYLAWTPGEDTACLDADFTADDLEAIAFWMRLRMNIGERNG